MKRLDIEYLSLFNIIFFHIARAYPLVRVGSHQMSCMILSTISGLDNLNQNLIVWNDLIITTFVYILNRTRDRNRSWSSYFILAWMNTNCNKLNTHITNKTKNLTKSQMHLFGLLTVMS